MPLQDLSKHLLQYCPTVCCGMQMLHANLCPAKKHRLPRNAIRKKKLFGDIAKGAFRRDG